MLEAARDSGVKKVIVTSSANTVQNQLKGEGMYDHTSFIPEHKGMNGYYRSKNRSEKFAFDFMKKIPEKERTFDL